jgi:hypothetical protein
MNEGKRGYKVVRHAASPSKPETKKRNPVAKNVSAAIGGGAAGAHKDKKKSVKQGETKHKKRVPADMLEGSSYEKKLSILLKMEAVKSKLQAVKESTSKQGVAEAYGRRDAYQRDYDSSVSGMDKRQSYAYQQDGGANDEYNTPEYDPELQRNRQETMMYNVTVDGKPVTPNPLLGRSAAIAWAKEQVAAGKLDPKVAKLSPVKYGQGVAEAEKKGLYYYVNKRKKAGTSRDASSPKAPTAQAWKDAAKTAKKEDMAERFDSEYNDEAGMAHSNLRTMARAVDGLLKTIKSNDNLPEWGQEKIAKAEMMLVSVWDYLLSQKELGRDPKINNQGVAEDDYMESLAVKLAEKIPKGADAEYYIKDFEKSNAPQFRGKSKTKRREMAIAAYTASKKKR